MSSVDDRIVNMQFNNKQFTQGAAESQRALEGLDQTIANTGKGGGLTTMGTAVDGVKAKFSALQVAGVAALATIVSKATNAGIGLIKSLTLDPLTQGFQEYQTNLDSIQTVMANTGKGVNEVNKYMQQLNKYSDQTIYNFSEMAHNIGTFTAAGVDLKTATASIQGIANLAALSGSSSQQASTAMYQLSQAISAGRVGLQDWNSVVNAGMGGKVFQTALAQNAVAMGALNKGAVDLGGKMGKLTVQGESFRQSISAVGGASWLTGDVLTKTLSLLDGRLSKSYYLAQNFTEKVAEQKVSFQQAKLASQGYSKQVIKDMTATANRAYESATVVKSLPQLMDVLKESIGSIWSNSFSAIMGNFEQSKTLWTSISKKITGPQGFITKMGTSWAQMLKGWGKHGGRDDVIKGFGKMFNNLGKMFKEVGKAWKEVFPPATKNTLLSISDAFLNFTRHLVLHKKVLAGIRNIFAGVFAAMHIGVTIVKALWGLFSGFFGALGDGSKTANHGIFSLLGSIGKVVVAFDKWLSSGNKLVDGMHKIGETAGKFVAPVVQGVGAIVRAFAILVRGGSKADISAPLKEAGAAFATFLSSVLGGLAALTSPFSKISGLFTSFQGRIEGIKSSITGISSPTKSVSTDLGKMGQVAGAAGDLIGTKLDRVRGSAEYVKKSVTDMFNAFSGSSSVEAQKKSDDMASKGLHVESVWDNVKMVFGMLGKGIKATFAGLGKAAGWVISQFGQLFGGMDALDWASLLNTLFSGALILSMRNFLNSFSQIGKGVTDTLGAMQNSIKADTILAIAAAIGVLAASLIALSLVNPGKMKGALAAIGAMGLMMMHMMNQIDKIGKSTNAQGEVIQKFNANMVLMAAAMLVIAASMIIFAAAVAIFGNMDLGTLVKGFGAMAAAMTLMLLSMNAFKKIGASAIEGMAGSILIMAVAMVALAVAVAMFGNMDIMTLVKGFGAMAVGLGLMVVAMLGLDKMKGSPEGLAASLVVMAIAMNLLVHAIGALGKMSIGTLVKGLVGLTVGLVLMVGALYLLSQLGPEVVLAAGAMALLGFAMIEMAKAVGMFGSMSWGTLAKGFIAIAAGLAILIVAAGFAEAVAPGLIVLGVAVALIGAAMFLAGAGMLAFATGFALLATVGVAGVAIITLAIEAFMALLPGIAVQVAAAFVAFIEVIAKASPRLRKAFDEIFKNILGTIQDSIGPMKNLFVKLIDAGIAVLKNAIPKFIELAFTIIDSFLTSMSKHIPHIVKVVGNLIVGFINAVSDNLRGIIDAGTNLLLNFMDGVAKNTRKLAIGAGKMILNILTAIDDAVNKYSSQITQKGIDIGADIIKGVIKGIVDATGLGDAFSNLTGKIGDGFNSVKSHLGLRVIAGSQKSIFDQASSSLRAAYALIDAQLGAGVTKKQKSKITQAQKAAVNAAAAASAADTRAQQAQQHANELAKIANQKKATKAQHIAANHAKTAADKAAVAAQHAEQRAQGSATHAQNVIDFAQADDHGRGDLLSEQATNLADRANKLLAKANAEAAKAKELGNKAGKAMLAQARKDAAEAKKLADQAKSSQQQATNYYEREVTDRIKQLQADTQADKQARDDQAKYDAADNAGKAAIMDARAKADAARATKAQHDADALIKKAQKLAKTDAVGAMKLLDKAEELSQTAKDAQDQADQEAQQVKDLLGQTDTATPTTDTNGNSIVASRTVLEDAAKAVDRYTESLAQASELAAANQQPVQFTQNINAPQSPDAVAVYRQTKNLLTAKEVKMGAKP